MPSSASACKRSRHARLGYDLDARMRFRGAPWFTSRALVDNTSVFGRRSGSSHSPRASTSEIVPTGWKIAGTGDLTWNAVENPLAQQIRT
jgi:hypothetical protein